MGPLKGSVVEVDLIIGVNQLARYANTFSSGS